MPRLEPKAVQKELQQGQIWPVYWIYGPERMKSRELVRHIRNAVLGTEAAAVAGFSFAEENFDGAENDASRVIDAARSLSLGGGVRFIVVKDAHQLKNPEDISELLAPRTKKDELASVCVFLAKELDGRRKISKLLVEKAAVVECEDVAEGEREAWVNYLAKRRGLALPAGLAVQLCSFDPWTLDGVDQELEKFALTRSSDSLQDGNRTGQFGTDQFLDAFFTRNLKASLLAIESFADEPEEAFMLLGLFAWNVRYFAVFVKDQGRGARINPYVAERFRKWAKYWKLEEILALESVLSGLDFQLKQTPLLPLGGWGSLAMRFCGE